MVIEKDRLGSHFPNHQTVNWRDTGRGNKEVSSRTIDQRGLYSFFHYDNQARNKAAANGQKSALACKYEQMRALRKFSKRVPETT